MLYDTSAKVCRKCGGHLPLPLAPSPLLSRPPPSVSSFSLPPTLALRSLTCSLPPSLPPSLLAPATAPLPSPAHPPFSAQPHWPWSYLICLKPNTVSFSKCFCLNICLIYLPFPEYLLLLSPLLLLNPVLSFSLHSSLLHPYIKMKKKNWSAAFFLQGFEFA